MSEPDSILLLDTALEELLPDNVRYSASLIPETPDFEFREEAECMKSAGEYRKREFAAGRACARGALVQLGYSRSPLLVNGDGLPVLPDGAVACISHSRGYCAAIAARSADYRTLGIDLEMTNRLSASAIERTVHPVEQVYVKGDQKRASLIFCAKEAFFKLQFPIWHTYANFHDLALAIDEKDHSISIRLIDDRFPLELRALSDEITFRYRYFGDFVLTACWLRGK